jgi:hypothetical protein
LAGYEYQRRPRCFQHRLATLVKRIAAGFSGTLEIAVIDDERHVPVQSSGFDQSLRSGFVGRASHCP